MEHRSDALEKEGEIPEKEYSSMPVGAIFSHLRTSKDGLSTKEASARITVYGRNDIRKRPRPAIIDLAKRATSPLIILLFIIAVFSLFFGDKVSALVIVSMMVMSVTISFVQERRARLAARRLIEKVRATCVVVRDGKEKEISVTGVVPGDIISLSAGDMVPGDIRLIAATDLFLDQSSLTGESFPVEKVAEIGGENAPLKAQNIALMGSSVVNGTGRGVVVETGFRTVFGHLSEKLSADEGKTLFDTQTEQFTWAMVRVIGVVIVAIMAIYAFQGRSILGSILFALAVAVQITPETLPMVITLNLSRGALDMAKKKVIVKKLNAIQNLGAMDVICSDKTGTLTLNKVVLERHIDIHGHEDENVFRYGYMNSFYQTGIRNLLNKAILSHKKENLHGYVKMGEIPFDFKRRINSVIVDDGKDKVMVSIGAPEEIVKRCIGYEEGAMSRSMSVSDYPVVLKQYKELSSEGYRVLAVAYKETHRDGDYSSLDEQSLILKGFLAFLDPPKPTAKAAIDRLRNIGVSFKIVTGDNELVTKKICFDLGIQVDGIILGDALDGMSDMDIAEAAETTTVFARVSPEQKERVIKALHLGDHTVGYIGDGVNDTLSLRAADIGISVDNAVDIAKETAGIVLLDKDLHVLVDGVLEGRKVFGNFMKYIQMTGTVNVGYMLSTIGASLILPFFPMAPVQMLLNNYLYEVGQTVIPTDKIGNRELRRPRKWHIGSVVRFMTVMGIICAVFDIGSFGIFWLIFGGASGEGIFQTSWFIQTMIFQLLLIFIFRLGSDGRPSARPSMPLILMAVSLISIVIVLPYTPLSGLFRLVPPPLYFYPLVLLLVFIRLLVIWLIKTRVFGGEDNSVANSPVGIS
ncbi:MAG: magnesium-translocating P-type ATPase [Candidatus Colwellbacteria bacterium]|nr:magnesium-translocating P-type ATPase [Candidatus Colwellbacteria bacterium]